jgi:1-acyl-sn-glycerol-3-phosphate acyltransferase
VSPPGRYKTARPGIGHIAHQAGATIVPVHLDGPRKLYRWWSWPKITATVGTPIVIGQDDDPSREHSQATAEQVLEAIKALGPGS